MATDPSMTEEQKRRQRQQQRVTLNRPDPATLAFAPNALAIQNAPGAGVGPVPAPAPSPRRQFRDVQGRVSQTAPRAGTPTEFATDARRSGLSRVVRTAPGVYTDAPDAQGDVRFYDETGSRADINDPISQGQIGRGQMVADYFAATNDPANRRDLSSIQGQEAALGQGQRARGSLQRLQAEAEERDARASNFYYDTNEAGVPTLRDARVQPPQGLGRGGAGRGQQGPDFSDQLALIRFQYEMGQDAQSADLDERRFGQQQLEAERDQFNENPQQYIQQFFGRLRGLNEQQRQQALESPQGRLIFAEITNRARQQQTGPLAGLRSTDPRELELDDLFASSLGGYGVRGDEILSTALNPGNPFEGISPEDRRTLQQFATRMRATQGLGR